MPQCLALLTLILALKQSPCEQRLILGEASCWLNSPQGALWGHLLLVQPFSHWRLGQGPPLSHIQEDSPPDTVITHTPQMSPVTCASGVHGGNHTVQPEEGRRLLLL